MKWIISHQSALEAWRKANTAHISAWKKIRNMKPHATPLNIKELEIENLQDLTKPIHVLVGDRNARKVNPNLCFHVSPGSFPDWSFIRMSSGLIASSPELCFLQMAGRLSFADLVKLGYEFCGSYRTNQDSTVNEGAKNKGFRDSQPLTSVKKLSSYINKTVGFKGRKKAIKALKFIVDGSASPMETILTMLLILPYRLGGYGFPKPMLNFRIEVSLGTRETNVDYPVMITISSTGTVTTKSYNASADKVVFFCDLYWPDKKVAVEYDSDEYHTGSRRIEKDALRRNALTGIGVTVFTVSRRQLKDREKMRKLAEELSKPLGKRIRVQEKDFILQHAKLLDQLLPERSQEW